jgi:pimeloyl-ACP methyl ester carboxylesterase
MLMLSAGELACENFLFLICGFDATNLNKTRLTVYMTHTPAGTSVQNMIHFMQGVQTDQFQMYDFGTPAENLRHYGQTIPPLYDLSSVHVPVALYYGGNDWLADPYDVEWIKPQLPNLIYSLEVHVSLGQRSLSLLTATAAQIEEFEHLDFLWATNAVTQVYNQIIALMKAA